MRPIFLVIACYCLFLSPAVRAADSDPTPELAVPPAEPVAPDPAPMLSAAQLHAAADLKAPVTLAVARQPLLALIGALAKQGKVELKPAPGVTLPEVLVTAGVDKLPVGDFMSALGRIYGMTWSRVEDGVYYLWPTRRNDFETKMLQLGDSWRVVSNEVPADSPRAAAMLKSIVEPLGEANLRAPGGVAYTALPPEIQQIVKHSLQERVASTTMFASYLQVTPDNVNDVRLSFRPVKSPTGPAVGVAFRPSLTAALLGWGTVIGDSDQTPSNPAPARPTPAKPSQPGTGSVIPY